MGRAVREIRMLRATWRDWKRGTVERPAGAPSLDPPMSGMWKRSHGELLRARQTKGAATDMFYLTTTAPHLDSTKGRYRALSRHVRVV